MRRIISALLLLAAISATAFAQTQAPPAPATQSAATTQPHNFDKWEAAISKYEAADKENPPKPGCVVFIGSSTILRWKTLNEDFPGVDVINRGFGGSEVIDAAHFADRIVTPYKPAAVFFRSGGNDIHAHKSAEQVLEHYKQFVDTVHAASPATKIFWIGLSPAPSRIKEAPENKKLNDLVEDYSKDKEYLGVIDAYDVSLDKDGNVREDLFVDDRLHFNAEGYKVLIARVRPYVEQFKSVKLQ